MSDQQRHNNVDLTSLFCISANRSGRVKNRTAGVLASDGDLEWLLDNVSLADAGELELLTLFGELSKSAANDYISTKSTTNGQIWQTHNHTYTDWMNGTLKRPLAGGQFSESI